MNKKESKSGHSITNQDYVINKINKSLTNMQQSTQSLNKSVVALNENSSLDNKSQDRVSIEIKGTGDENKKKYFEDQESKKSKESILREDVFSIRSAKENKETSSLSKASSTVKLNSNDLGNNLEIVEKKPPAPPLSQPPEIAFKKAGNISNKPVSISRF
jgi:hypothetical protein